MILWFLLIGVLQISPVLLNCGCQNANIRSNAPKQPLQNSIGEVDCAESSLKDMVSQKATCKRLNSYEQPENMSLIPGNIYEIGTNKPYFREDAESPARAVNLQAFFMDKYEVSNERFAEFIRATNYTTDAERYGDSFIFKSLLSKSEQEHLKDYRVAIAPWWFKVKGVNWKHPMGARSIWRTIANHPVVHVSWHDAKMYCEWRGKRLPSEAEWEVACRGGKKGRLYPWGNKFQPKNCHWMNIWQGKFPDENMLEDKYETTCPVTEFCQNDYKMHNIVGNVWEWTADRWHPLITEDERVKKGGSYLCHQDYCYRYRCAARSHNTADSSAGNLGFRCAQTA